MNDFCLHAKFLCEVLKLSIACLQTASVYLSHPNNHAHLNVG